MKLIAGLGNPGPKYSKTRHNFGFMAVDYLQKNLGGFDNWSLDQSANVLISKGEFFGEQIILAKPQTFMNLSGQAVQKLASFYKISADDIWIVHDDFDLPLGIIRINKGVSCAGHKGVKSIIEALGTKDFVRVRLGIHAIGQTFLTAIFKKMASLEKFVLKSFSKEEQKSVSEIIQKTCQAIEIALKEGMSQAMNQFN